MRSLFKITNVPRSLQPNCFGYSIHSILSYKEKFKKTFKMSSSDSEGEIFFDDSYADSSDEESEYHDNEESEEEEIEPVALFDEMQNILEILNNSDLESEDYESAEDSDDLLGYDPVEELIEAGQVLLLQNPHRDPNEVLNELIDAFEAANLLFNGDEN